MEPVKEEKKYSSAQEFVERLLKEGDKTSCDDHAEVFFNHDDLPPFYNEKLFKKGQQFFYKHLFSFFFSKCLGLIAVLSIPSVLKVLMFTRMSSSQMTSYRRYVATILHMMVWYDSDFKPGSKLWKSIAEVRNRHNSASNRSCSAGMRRITQKDMTLTQFGFMGISICRSEKLGIYGSSEEEWEGFVHVWKVIGYLMGIEDRFNLCNGTVKETRERCNILMEQVFRPFIEEKNEDFINMSRYMVEGLWSINLLVKFDTLMHYLHSLSLDQSKEVKCDCYKLNEKQKPNLNLLVTTLSLMRWNLWRWFLNYSHLLTLWFMKVFPVLAMFQYGWDNARVKILTSGKTQ